MESVTVETVLPAPAPVVWAAVRRPEAFVHVAGSMLRYPAAEQLQGPMQPGERITGWLLLFRLIPVSRQTIEIASIDDVGMRLLSNEYGGVIRDWKHHVTVEPLDDERCRYEDRLDIDAGILTPIVVAFARVFFRYRHRRWFKLARLLAASAEASQPRPSRAGSLQPPSTDH